MTDVLKWLSRSWYHIFYRGNNMASLFTNKLSQINVQTSSNTAKQSNFNRKSSWCACFNKCLFYYLFSFSCCWTFFSYNDTTTFTTISLPSRSCFLCARFYHCPTRLCLFPTVVFVLGFRLNSSEIKSTFSCSLLKRRCLGLGVRSHQPILILILTNIENNYVVGKFKQESVSDSVGVSVV